MFGVGARTEVNSRNQKPSHLVVVESWVKCFFFLFRILVILPEYGYEMASLKPCLIKVALADQLTTHREGGHLGLGRKEGGGARTSRESGERGSTEHGGRRPG